MLTVTVQIPHVCPDPGDTFSFCLMLVKCIPCFSDDFLPTVLAFIVIPFMEVASICPPQVDIHVFNCSRSGLADVPRRAHSETLTVDLSQNQLAILHEDSFAEYHRLSKLILDYNQIYKITDRAMNSLSLTLEYLSLRGNRLSNRISSDFAVSALHKLRNLRFLDLSENPLGVLGTNWLTPLGGTLRTLDLSGLVGETEIQEEAFFGLGHLEELDFSNNGIRSLPEDAFKGIRREKLAKLSLRDNPWHCDCKLLWLRQWLDDLRDRPLAHEQFATGTCSSPAEFDDAPLISLPLNRFQCPPMLQAMHSSAPYYFAQQGTTVHVVPSVGDSITLNCAFVSQPKMLVKWFKNGVLLRPELKRFRHTVSKGTRFASVLTITALKAPGDNGNYTYKSTSTVVNPSVKSEVPCRDDSCTFATSFEVDDVTNSDTCRPVVRTFAPLLTYRDDEKSDGESGDLSIDEESFVEVDKACPVHGIQAKNRTLFCPFHSQQSVFFGMQPSSGAFSSNDALGTRRRWNTLESARRNSGVSMLNDQLEDFAGLVPTQILKVSSSQSEKKMEGEAAKADSDRRQLSTYCRFAYSTADSHELKLVEWEFWKLISICDSALVATTDPSPSVH
uniref:Ig-like domain-containing protein n=1 Tax=Mesocestoides corti TaxID=53468 RepID=A0A5K3FA63_MESCO